MDSLEKRVVTKSNALVRSRFHLTLAEMRLVLCVIAQLNPKEELQSSKRYYLHAQTYADMFGIQQDGAYKVLRDAIDSLYNRTIKIKVDGEKEVLEFRWIQAKSYIDKKGKVSIKLTDDILPFLSELQSHFTRYFLTETKNIDSVYAIRLFEIAKSYLSLSEWTVGIDEFKEIFDISPDYRQDNIQARVIKPSIEMINKHTSVKIECEPYRVGRAVGGYTFRFTENKKIIENKIKKIAESDKLENSPSWGNSENFMLKNLMAGDSTLTKQHIEKMAKNRNVDISLILHELTMKLSSK